MTGLPPIPEHLPAWQAGHLAWLASQGHPTRYDVPEGTAPVRADLTGAVLRVAVLTGADLTGAVLTGAVLSRADLTGAVLRVAVLSRADLTGAVLTGAVLTGAYLTGAYLYGADLTGADLREADLTGAVLTGADLSRADLSRAVLSRADLSRAVLTGASGIASYGPIGRHGRTIYAVAHDDGPRIQAGCWWGSVPDTIARIEADYSDDPAALDRYVAAVRTVAALVTP